MGASYYQKNLDSLNFDGRLLLKFRSGLRNRSLENKALIVSGSGEEFYKSFPLSEASKAHQLMESSQHIGKILLLP
ncbi:hypothetical protein JHK82_037198 [Glycine max]|uniref:Uncharacterized protein n=2 Tax=Glycine subgen. Soja TaxID=1462606 RepID=I1M2B7_SOYBN|nr:hypothetical protein JHK85_037955 [Glycine max]KAG5113929.1 hypothetical protein JHK82_037198 [Glycine max]KAG5131210.1 hypothetical protein JHK84_037607 [Glycine max]KHN08578.1 hypothetical protein glysoja_014343 [Glycine soja]RZB82694.1 hypothetical protein D0Y65_031683 [Glycine soja]